MKIVVVGAPGSGKSYLALKIKNHFNIPHIEGDMYYWRNSAESSRNDFRSSISQAIKQEDWVYEGHITKVFDIISDQTPLLVVINESIPFDFFRILFKDFQKLIPNSTRNKSKKRILHHIKKWAPMRESRNKLIQDYLKLHPQKVIFWDRTKESVESLLKRTH